MRGRRLFGCQNFKNFAARPIQFLTEMQGFFAQDVALRESLNLPPSPLKVLVVDDHAIVRFGLAVLIEREPGMSVVGSVGTGGEWRSRLHAPNLCVPSSRSTPAPSS
jgi:hypothetical protein